MFGRVSFARLERTIGTDLATETYVTRPRLGPQQTLWRKLLAFLPYLLLLVIIAYLFRQFHDMHWIELYQEIRDRTAVQLLIALGLVCLNYLVFTSYDLIALRQMNARLPLWTVAKTAALSFAFSNILGHSMITGLGIRFRNYSTHGLSLKQVTGIVIQNVEAWWVGFLFISGVFLTLIPYQAHIGPLPQGSMRWLGIFLLSTIAIYLIACLRLAGRSVALGKMRVHLPDVTGGLLKIAVASADVLITASTLFVLLPNEVKIPIQIFVVYYVVAQLAGTISAIPGGLGVTESVFLELLRPFDSEVSILASLILYRVAHYILPALIALFFELARIAVAGNPLITTFRANKNGIT